mgnify:CR=1 FL=1
MNITSGIIEDAQRVIVYGPEGIGKSTFASKFPGAIFIDTEGSTKRLNVKRFDKPSSWTMLLEEVKYVRDHPELCMTLVIDTADWAEQLASNHICSVNHKQSIEDFGYGKGYTKLYEEFGRLLDLLNEVISKGINVVLTAHAKMRKFEQPDELGAYDRWEMKLSAKTAPLVKEWADMVLFANYKTFAVKTENGKTKGQGGERRMYTTHHPCWDAKNRFGLPGEMPFDYAGIAPVIGDGKNISENFSGNEPLAVNSADETPDKCKDVSDAPAQAAVSEPAKPDGTVPDIPAGIPQALRDLMQANNVTATDIQTAVSAKGYFPLGMEITDYPADFVNGCLIGAWDQLYQVILKERKDIPF